MSSCLAGPSFRAVSCLPNISRASTIHRNQLRTYAVARTPDQAKAARQGYRGKEGGGKSQGLSKKDKNPGAFRPLPAAQLSNPALQTSKAEELNLLPFFNSAVGKKSMVGKATQFIAKENDPFRIFGLPKNMLIEFRILSKPCSVVRDVTLTTVQKLENASMKSSESTRMVFTGSSGCGKSFLLLQALEYCVAKNWIVIYIPRAVNLVNSTTGYVYYPRTKTYLQPVFAYQTLQRLLGVNAAALENIKTQKEITIEKKPLIPIGTALREVVLVGTRDQSVAPTILEVLLAELEAQTDYPVLLAVDDFQAMYCKTAYRDPQFASIKSYHLSMPRILMEYANGTRSFSRGAVLGAINSSDPLYPVPLELHESLGLPINRPAGPFEKRSTVLQDYARGLQSIPVPESLSMKEAASLFEVWMKDNALVPSVYDELFMSKYTESSGNARGFVWKGLLSTLTL